MADAKAACADLIEWSLEHEQGPFLDLTEQFGLLADRTRQTRRAER